MRLRSLIFCAVALTMAFACSKKNYTPESTTTTQPETPIPQPPAGDADEAAYQFNVSTDKVVLSHEFRGAWLATVSGTDWPKTKLNSSAQKAELTKYLEGIADAGCNVVFFQVCSNMDALWPSKLLPWSSVLTGTEGIDPGYDPTAFAVEKAHQLGLEIHAWINP
ncbi:MAG: family 10 glycosylhydrolase, partial [Bacteroidales bacterium]|nr:family 10 glycosylhydrolase [Bacteroidales bacterium]